MSEHLETMKEKVEDPNNRLVLGMALGAVGVIAMFRLTGPVALTVTQETAKCFLEQKDNCRFILFKHRLLGTIALSMIP